MSQVAFLLDEQMPQSVLNAVLSLEPSIQIWQVGTDPFVPTKGTLDPGLLFFAEKERLALVTYDKTTMPGHTANHLAAGHHTYGVFILPNGFSLSAGRVADELMIMWVGSQADEWIDQIVYLP